MNREKKQAMRLLLFSVAYPGEAGGVQGVFNRLAATLRRRGHQVDKTWAVPNPDPTADDTTYSLAHLERNGNFPTPRSTLRVGRSFLRVARRLRQRRPDIVNVHFVSCEAAYFLRLRPLLGYKLVLSVHGSDIFRPNERDAKYLPRLLKKADAITAVTPLLAERVKGFAGVDPDKVRLIPNGVDYEFWSTVDPSDLAQRPPTIIAVGRLSAVKAQDVLLRGFRQVRERVPDVKLLLVGGGPSREEFEALARQLELGDSVEFAGELRPEAVRARMQQARVFVLPSRSEGLPLALLEAMAAGLPPVATAVGGVPNVLEPDAGLLVPPEDPAALAEALSNILSDPQRAGEVAHAARTRAADFSAEAANDAYESLFLHLLVE